MLTTEELNNYYHMNTVQKIDFIREKIKIDLNSIEEGKETLIYWYNINVDNNNDGFKNGYFKENGHHHCDNNSLLDLVYLMHDNGIKFEENFNFLSDCNKLTLHDYQKLEKINIGCKYFVRHAILTTNYEAFKIYSEKYFIPSVSKIEKIYTDIADFGEMIQTFVICNRNKDNFDDIYKQYVKDFINIMKILISKTGADIESCYLSFVRLILFTRYGTKNLVSEIYQMLTSVFSPYREISVLDEEEYECRDIYIIDEKRLFKNGPRKLFEILLIFLIVYGDYELLKYFAGLDEFVFYDVAILYTAISSINCREIKHSCSLHSLVRTLDVLKENGKPLILLWEKIIEKQFIKILRVHNNEEDNYYELLSYIVKEIGEDKSSDFLSKIYTEYIFLKNIHINHFNFCTVSVFMSKINISVLHKAFKKIMHFILDSDPQIEPNEFIFRIMNASSNFNNWIDDDLMKKINNNDAVSNMIHFTNSRGEYKEKNFFLEVNNPEFRSEELDQFLYGILAPYLEKVNNENLDRPSKKIKY